MKKYSNIILNNKLSLNQTSFNAYSIISYSNNNKLNLFTNNNIKTLFQKNITGFD